MTELTLEPGKTVAVLGTGIMGSARRARWQPRQRGTLSPMAAW